jgi:hypothetical protein
MLLFHFNGRLGLASGLHILFQVLGQQSEKVSTGIFPFSDGMGTVWVGKHFELLIVLDQLIDQYLTVLIMYVIITGAMD